MLQSRSSGSPGPEGVDSRQMLATGMVDHGLNTANADYQGLEIDMEDAIVERILEYVPSTPTVLHSPASEASEAPPVTPIQPGTSWRLLGPPTVTWRPGI